MNDATEPTRPAESPAETSPVTPPEKPDRPSPEGVRRISGEEYAHTAQRAEQGRINDLARDDELYGRLQREEAGMNERAREYDRRRDAGVSPAGIRAIQEGAAREGAAREGAAREPANDSGAQVEPASAARPAEQPEAAVKDTPEKGPYSETTFTDKAGRPIVLQGWKNGTNFSVRAYDTDQGAAPDRFTIGQAGYADGYLEKSWQTGDTRLKLGYVSTQPEYRRSGIGGKMLEQMEQFGRDQGASEIYGPIENDEALAYWKAQAHNGWTIDPSGGYYGTARKRLDG